MDKVVLDVQLLYVNMLVVVEDVLKAIIWNYTQQKDGFSA